MKHAHADPNLSSWVKTLFVFCFGFGTATTKTSFFGTTKKPSKTRTFKGIPLSFPQPSQEGFGSMVKLLWKHQHSWIYGSMVDFLFGTIKKIMWKHIQNPMVFRSPRNILLLTFLVDHVNVKSKHPFKGYRLPKKSGHIKNPHGL